MRVTTSITWSLTTGEVLDHQWYEYGGTWQLCKGEDKAAEQMRRANNLQEKELAMQTERLNMVKDSIGKYLSGDIGLDPKALAIMKAQFLDSNAADFSNANQGLKSMLAARGSGGGDLPVGGDWMRQNSGLFGQAATAKAQGVAGIDLANLQQMLANKFNAASVISGNAATLSSPIATFGSMSSSALNDYIKAKNSGFLSSLGGALGGALGGGLGGGITGGLGTVFSHIGSGAFGW